MIEWERVHVSFDVFAASTWACGLCGSIVIDAHRPRHEEYHFPPLQDEEVEQRDEHGRPNTA